MLFTVKNYRKTKIRAKISQLATLTFSIHRFIRDSILSYDFLASDEMPFAWVDYTWNLKSPLTAHSTTYNGCDISLEEHSL